jgi:hypothetical protein
MGDTSAARVSRFGSTLRQDPWWTENLPFLVVFGGFLAYATWRAFQGKFYWAAPYLSPFYSPLIDPDHHFWPFSPALLILGIPGGFRITCYYYRKAYYRGAFLDPPACAVGEGRKSYSGERRFPFILQNVHRYFFYLVAIVLIFLWKDTVVAFDFDGKFGIGVGTLVMLLNVILLTTYSLSCHSLRHLIGGKLDCFSCTASGGPRYAGWKGVTKLNEHHMFWAWVSMISVGLTDFYIYLVASGVIRDIRIL